MDKNNNKPDFTPNKLGSVHLQMFPLVDKASGLKSYKVNQDIISQMDITREICGVVLSIRKKHNIRTRMPIKYIKIIGTNLSGDLIEVVKDETNVKDVLFADEKSVKIEKTVKLNFKAIGAKVGSKMNEITNAVKTNNFKIENNQMHICGFVLINNEDFTYTNTISQNGYNTATEDYQLTANNAIPVIVCIQSNEELELEGICRDFVRLIQTKRKEQNFEITDKISIKYNTNDDIIKKAITNHLNYIQSQTLCTNISIETNIDKLEKITFASSDLFILISNQGDR